MSTHQFHPILSSSSSGSRSNSRTPTPVACNNNSNMIVNNNIKNNNDNSNNSDVRNVSPIQLQQGTPFPSISNSQLPPFKKDRMSMESDSGLKTPVYGSNSIERAGSHLRSLSIASTNSTGSSNTNHLGKKMGINLGLSFTGSGLPTGGSNSNSHSHSHSHNNNNNNNYVFTTPRLRSSSVKSPTFSISESNQNSNNRFDEYQEVEYDSQSPEPLTPIRQNSSSTISKGHNHHLSNLNLDTKLLQTNSLIPDTPPPPQSAKSIKVNQSSNLLSDQLRLLASKEMEILDIKNQINTLNDRKRNLEFELQDLKVKVEKQLVLQITKQNNIESNSPSGKKISPFNRHIPKSPLPFKRGALHHFDSVGDPLLDDGFSSSSNDLGDEIDKIQADTNSINHNNPGSSGSWFSKPLNFFQQFDNMIYQEIEKLQLPGLAEEQKEEYEKEFRNKQQQHREQSKKYQKDDSSYVHVDKKEINEPIKALASLSSGSTSGNDVMQSVSNQLWSFVNEVKTNLINDDLYENHQEQEQEQEQETKFSPTSRRFRTPSLSKRQSYGQYANKTYRKKSISISKPHSVHLHEQSEGEAKASESKKEVEDVDETEKQNHESRQKEAGWVLSSINDSLTSIDNQVSSSSDKGSEYKKSVELKTFEKVDESDLWDNDAFEDL